MNTATLDHRLTGSEMQCAKTCARRHQIAYLMRIRPDNDAKPLRMGKAFHLGLEAYGNGETPDSAVLTAVKEYDRTAPTTFRDAEQETDWLVEREIVARLLTGYFWRWAEMDKQMQVLACETAFEIPLVNPATGRAARIFSFAGKIDKVVKLPDGRLAVMEHKTTGSDLAPESDYWARLRIDSQISGYILGARALGHDVETVLYDVARKPSIRLKQKETVEQYGDRLTADIAARPDWYFARREIARLKSDLEEAQYDLWHTAQLIHECAKEGRHPKNTGACIGFGTCPYFRLCTNGFDVNNPVVPDGFKVVDDVHQELLSE